MSPLLLYALVLHIGFGLLGVVAITSFLLMLTRGERNLSRLEQYSFWGLFSFLISWVAGGYYYSTFYGKTVKPVILAGDYPWVHQIIMEAKEHVFIFVPILAAVLFALIVLLGQELLEKEKTKKAVMYLTILLVGISSLMALMGFVISGSVDRKTPASSQAAQTEIRLSTSQKIV